MNGRHFADPRREQVYEEIKQHGYALNTAKHPIALDPFTHTVGFSAIRGHPELVFYQWTPPVIERTVATMFEKVQAGHLFQHGDMIDGLITGYPVIILMVPIDVSVPIAVDLYGALEVRAIRVLSPDRRGRFPWDDGSEISHHPYHPEDVPTADKFNVYSI